MMGSSSDYVFLVMVPTENECGECLCDEHWAVGSVWAEREAADAEAAKKMGSYVLPKYVRNRPEDLP